MKTNEIRNAKLKLPQCKQNFFDLIFQFMIFVQVEKKCEKGMMAFVRIFFISSSFQFFNEETENIATNNSGRAGNVYGYVYEIGFSRFSSGDEIEF